MKNLDFSQKKLTPSALTAAVAMFILPAVLVACGKSEWREVGAPNTGDAKAELTTGDLNAGIIAPEQEAFVAPDRLRGRDTPDQDPAAATTLLEQGDAVQIVSAQPVKDPIDNGDLVEVRVESAVPSGSATVVEEQIEEPVVVKRSVTLPPVWEKKAPAKTAPVKTQPSKKVETPVASKTVAAKPTVTPASKPAAVKKSAKKTVYVPIRYLQKNPVRKTKEAAAASRFIMIQNIASAKLRVYERAAKAGEPNTLLFETDMFNGEYEPQTTRRTALGSFKIEKWIKFYQDYAGIAPSWFDPQAETVPLPGSEVEDWTQTYFLQKKGEPARGYIRGGFGWYTAKIGPDANAQWTHGTLGWGADKDRFIKNVSHFKLKEFYGDPRVFGCTRVENQAIALLQALLPVGTPVIKVYAKETLADATLARYRHTPRVQSWDWILTKDEVRKENPHSSSGGHQIQREVSKDLYLEEGIYEFDAYPDAVQFEKTVKNYESSSTTQMVTTEANIYNLPRRSFHGEFLVDEGRFVNYKHPSELRKGGYSDQLLPKVVVKTKAVTSAPKASAPKAKATIVAQAKTK